MSGKRIEIIEVVECEHGHPRDLMSGDWPRCVAIGCPGGSRRVLTEGQYVLIEKEGGEWPRWLADALGDVVHTALDGLPHEPARCAAIALGILGALAASAEGALSDHTEGHGNEWS